MKTIGSIIVVLVLVILGLSVYLAPNELANCKERPDLSAECAPADAIVTVSGGDTAARTQEAVRLYQDGWASKLVFSGAAQDKTGPSNAAVMRKTALALGVPDDDILTEEYGETTRQNAENTRAILEQNNIHSVILVTSAYHQRRAGLEFSKRAGDTVKLRNHPVAQDNQWSPFWWLTPGGWYLGVSEFIKVIVFYLGGTR